MSTLCRKTYSKKVSISLWILTEIAIIGADLQEVIGSAVAFNILFNIPIWVGVLITIIDTFIILIIQYFNLRKLEVIF